MKKRPLETIEDYWEYLRSHGWNITMSTCFDPHPIGFYAKVCLQRSPGLHSVEVKRKAETPLLVLKAAYAYILENGL